MSTEVPTTDCAKLNWTGGRGDGTGVGPGDTTLIYSGQIFLQSGDTHFIEQNDDNVLLQIDGQTILNDTAWNVPTVGTFTNSGGPGWFDIDLRFSNGGGGYGFFENGAYAGVERTRRGIPIQNRWSADP